MTALEVPSPLNSRARVVALDQFRGLLLLLMMLENVLSMYSFMPAALTRSGIYGILHIADLGAPMFFFTMGVALGLSFEVYVERNRVRAGALRFLRRNFFLILVGTVGVMIEHHNPLHDWSVLQAIGGAGIVALLFIRLPARWRWVVGLMLMIMFQMIVAVGYGTWLRAHDGGGLGGMLGGLVWGGIALFGSSVSEVLRSNWSRFRRLSLSMATVSALLVRLLMQFQMLDKRLATLPYLALTIALAALIMFCFAAIDRRWHAHSWLFSVLGANALLILTIQGLFVTFGSQYIPPQTPILPALLISASVFALCIGSAGWLYHKKIFLRL